MLTKEILCAYAPYGVGVKLGNTLRDLTSVSLDSPFVFVTAYKGSREKQMAGIENIQLLLRPLSSLTKPINWGLQTYEFTSLFEIGDDGGFIYDFGNGNTKLINDLETIAKYNSYHDINYLPYPVVKLMHEYHFDVHGLIESGHAIELKEVDNG